MRIGISKVGLVGITVGQFSNILQIALLEALKADHGFHVESRAIRDLVEILSTYDPPMRRAFLQFITGSPKLPIGGMCLARYAFAPH